MGIRCEGRSVSPLCSRMPQRAMLLLPLLASLAGLAVGEVGKKGNFDNCLQFFYKNTPPTGITGGHYAFVCQRYKNKYRFASLYDRDRRTPLYSAYLLTSGEGTRLKPEWMYEPQLASLSKDPQMEDIRNTIISKDVEQSQALVTDYNNSGYTKGHLNPSVHNPDNDDQIATYTLTNIVPQREGSNSGPWSSLEEGVKKRLDLYCLQPPYVITGVLPYKQGGPPPLNNRVAVPEYMWSAYCCPPPYKTKLPKGERFFFPTYAAVGRNDKDSGQEIVLVNPKTKLQYRGYDVKRMPLAELEVILKNRLGVSISLFDGQCLPPAP